MRLNIRIVRLVILACVSCGGCRTTPGAASGEDGRPGDVAYSKTPQPIGTSSRRHFARQEQYAEDSDFVVYQHEWFNGGLSLGPGGRRHVRQLVQRMDHEQFVVVVEPVEPDLPLHRDVDVAVAEAGKTDAGRRGALVKLLESSGVTDADSRVVIGWPRGEGLRGDEAPRVFRRLNSGVRGGGAFGGGGGGMGGGGMGGGGGFGGGGGGFGGRF
jgi:hypothetical protein